MNVVVTTDELEAIPQSYEQLVFVRAFYGANTHDDHWLGVYDVTPREAGLLLCGLDPLVLKKDDTAGEADKKRAKRLGRRFRGYNKRHPADRSWREWHAVAREIGADYDKGFDYFFDVLHRPSTDTVAVESTQAQAVQPQADAPAPVSKPKAKGRTTWKDVSTEYIVGVMRRGNYATCKELYRALEANAGPDSPFDKGTGDNLYSLFVREIAQPLRLKTVQNEWQMLRTLARK